MLGFERIGAGGCGPRRVQQSPGSSLGISGGRLGVAGRIKWGNRAAIFRWVRVEKMAVVPPKKGCRQSRVYRLGLSDAIVAVVGRFESQQSHAYGQGFSGHTLGLLRRI